MMLSSRLVRSSVSSMATREMSMKRISVIVTDNNPGLGAKGELISVRPGHARNHLFPKKMAVYDTEVNRIKFNRFTESIDLRAREEEQKQKLAISRVETVTVRVKRQVVGEEENGVKKLHAGVDVSDIVKKLWQQHFIHVSLEDVQLPEGKPLTKLGLHKVPVRVGEGSNKAMANLSVVIEAR